MAEDTFSFVFPGIKTRNLTELYAACDSAVSHNLLWEISVAEMIKMVMDGVKIIKNARISGVFDANGRHFPDIVIVDGLLEGATLRNVNIHMVLQNCIISNSVFSRCNELEFDGCNVKDTDLLDCTAYINKGNIKITAKDCKITANNATVRMSRFTQCDLCLEGLFCEHSRFSGCEISSCNQASFAGVCDFIDCNFSDASLWNTWFSNDCRGVAVIMIPGMSTRRDRLFLFQSKESACVKGGCFWGSIDQFEKRLLAYPAKHEIYIALLPVLKMIKFPVLDDEDLEEIPF